MAEFDNAEYIGDHTRQFTQDQLDTLRGYSKGLGYVPLAAFVRNPPSLFPVELNPVAAPNDNSKDSLVWTAPFPVKVVAIDVGCGAAGGSAATADVQVNRAGAGYASVLDAAEDIKTGAGTLQRVAPEDGEEDVDYGDLIKAVFVGTGAGAVTAAKAILWCRML